MNIPVNELVLIARIQGEVLAAPQSQAVLEGIDEMLCCLFEGEWDEPQRAPAQLGMAAALLEQLISDCEPESTEQLESFLEAQYTDLEEELEHIREEQEWKAAAAEADALDALVAA